MRAYERLAYKMFDRIAGKTLARRPQMKAAVAKADLRIRADIYISRLYLSCLVVAVASAVLSGLLAWISYGSPLFYTLLPIILIMPPILTAIIYAYGNFYPENRAKELQKNIDVHLPYALSYLSAISSAGMSPAEMFRVLSKQREIYGGMAREATKIHTDVSLFGKDVLEALKASAENSPSMRYREVINGLAATITSGGGLRQYLLAKSFQHIEENRRMQKGFLETLGVFAESYAVVGVAFPLFLMIILSVMMFVSTSTMSTSITLLYIVVFMMFPAISLVFAWIIRNTMPEV
jgi:flagellar protein FlaJ